MEGRPYIFSCCGFLPRGDDCLFRHSAKILESVYDAEDGGDDDQGRDVGCPLVLLQGFSVLEQSGCDLRKSRRMPW